MSAEKALEDLLASLFDSSGLRRFIYHLPPSGKAVANELPENLAIAELVHQAVRALQRHAMINSQFFGALCYERPERAGEIGRIGEQWYHNSRQRPDREGVGKTPQGSTNQGQTQNTTQTSTTAPVEFLKAAGVGVGVGVALAGGFALLDALVSDTSDSERSERYLKLLEFGDPARLRALLRKHDKICNVDEDLATLVVENFELNAGLIMECFTFKDLKIICEAFKVSKYGTKDDLAARIAGELDSN